MLPIKKEMWNLSCMYKVHHKKVKSLFCVANKKKKMAKKGVIPYFIISSWKKTFPLLVCSRQMLKVLLLITEKAFAIYNQYSAESKTVILGAPEVYVQVNNFLFSLWGFPSKYQLPWNQVDLDLSLFPFLATSCGPEHKDGMSFVPNKARGYLSE